MATEGHAPDREVAAVREDVEGDLARRFATPLRVMAARRLGDRAEAEDVAQEALARVLVALRAGRVRNLEALPGFVFETAKHLCLHRLRSRERAGRAFLSLAREPPPRDETTAPLGALLRSERVAGLRRAIAELGGEERELLRLAFAEGLNSIEIGRLMGIEAGAVRGRKHRLLRRLMASLPAGEDHRNSEGRAGTGEQEG